MWLWGVGCLWECVKSVKWNPKEFDYMKAFIKLFWIRELGTPPSVGAAHRSLKPERERRTRGERVTLYSGEVSQCCLV